MSIYSYSGIELIYVLISNLNFNLHFMTNFRNIFCLFFIFCVLSCKKNQSPIINITPGQTPDKITADNLEVPNILLIVADDLGLEISPSFSIDRNQVKPAMPNLEKLMQNGLTFSNVWANPLGAPTRATVFTGKYGLQTKVLAANDKIDLSEISIPKILKERGYSTGLVGKWHLSGKTPNPTDPNRMGIDYYAGLLKDEVETYDNWALTEDGSTSISTEYITTKLTDLGIDWIAQQEQPWFLWMAYSAPHKPYHLPPNHLHGQGNLPTDELAIDANPLPYYIAMVEALDTEMGRLINALSAGVLENTLIIFISDNGTPFKVSQLPGRKGKGTLYQGGINVPMVVAGKGILRKGRRTAELINSTDVFTTISEVVGNNVRTSDSRSFKNLLTNNITQPRKHLYAELNTSETGFWAIRDIRYKLIESLNGAQELYDLREDPFELKDLLKLPLNEEVQVAKIALEVRAQQIRLQ